MKTLLRGVGLAGLCLFLSGCIESTTLLDVRKDGSGTIRVQEYYSPQIMSMMEGFQDTARQMEMTFDDEDGVAHSADVGGELPADLFEEQIRSKIQEYGPGVTLEESREVTNDQGWKGFEAIYAFPDINRIQIGGTEMADADDDTIRYTFEFTADDTATLRIIPVRAETTAPAGEMDATDVEELHAGDMETMDDADMFGGMDAMFGNMFQGMRVRMLVRVDGEVVESNAEYPVAGRDNLFTLMDVEFDRFLDDPDALQLLMAEDPDALYKLKDKDIPGIRVEDPDQTITIRFR